MLTDFIVQFKNFLYIVAEVSAVILELIGILIIIIGSCRALVRLLRCAIKRETFHIVILCNALTLALEFKMGAEIKRTVPKMAYAVRFCAIAVA